MAHSERGLTLIELLVVIIIIGVLAAIAIPMFLEQREKAYEAQIQSSLRNAAKAIEVYAVGSGGSYASLDGLAGADLVAFGFPNSGYLEYLQISANASYYCIQARHRNLTTSSAWRRSIYQSWEGVPVPVPDTCPALPAP